MARLLFVVPPLAGHVNPTVGVAKALMDAGHAVAWVGVASKIKTLLAADAQLIPVDESQIAQLSENWYTKSQSVFGLESFKFFYEDFLVPLGHAMVDSVDRAVQDFKPDLIICDQQALAGWVVARKRNIRWVTSATTPAAVFNPLEQFPKVKEWMEDQLGKFQDHYQLERRQRPDLSEELVVIFTISKLVGEQKEMPERFRFVGPSLRQELRQESFPWEKLNTTQKKIYVSLGTVNATRSAKFYEKVKEAFTGKDLQIIMSAPPEMLGETADNFIVQKSVPQLELLKKMDAVIFHGGQNTFIESLNNGLPVVVAPIKDDQPVIAEQVVRCGVGIRIHFDRVKSADIYEATRKVLIESQFVKNAKEVQALLAKSGGAAQAANLIMKLLV